MARALTIDYGGFTVGDRPYSLHLPVSITSAYRQTTISAQVVVSGTSITDLENNEQALEAAFRKPRQVVTYTKDGSSRVYSEADRTALFIEATSRKVPDADFMGLAALYEISISWRQPANLAGEDFLLELNSVLTEDFSGKRTIEVRGQCTADDSANQSARTQLASVIDGAVSDVQDEVDDSATWEELASTESWDRYDQIVTWSRTVREIIADQGTTATNISSIRNESLSVVVNIPSPGDATFDTQRLIPALADFSCNIVHTVTTNIAAVYASEVRPLMLARIRAALGSGTIAIVDEVKEFDQSDNTLRARLSVLVAKTVVLESQRVTAISSTRGITMTPVWDGNQHSRAITPAPGELVRTDTAAVLVLGGAGEALAQARALIDREAWTPESFEDGSPGPNQGGAISGEEAATVGLGGAGGGWLIVAESEPQTVESIIGKAETFRVTALTLSVASVYVAPQVSQQGGTGDFDGGAP